jgi:hypothetical protein
VQRQHGYPYHLVLRGEQDDYLGGRRTSRYPETILANAIGRAKCPPYRVSAPGDQREIQNRIAQIKAQIEITTSDFDREKLQECLAKLSGGVAVLKVGAATGVEIVARVLTEPLKQIAINAGLEGSVVLEKNLGKSGEFLFSPAIIIVEGKNQEPQNLQNREEPCIMKKRIIAIVCLFSICLSASVAPAACAAELSGVDTPPPILRWINTNTITLDIVFSNGTAYCEGVIQGKTNVNKIEATFKLLKKNASGNFVTEYTWPKATSNSAFLFFSGTRSVTTGIYRLQVTADVTNTSNVTETVTAYVDKTYS